MLEVDQLREKLVSANNSGHTYREIAAWCDVNHATLHYFATNLRTPTYANLLKIKKGLSENGF